jgi:hypothetical protein
MQHDLSSFDGIYRSCIFDACEIQLTSPLALLCTALPVDSPLKAALTGLELLLARAQLWQETAAKHVSLGAQLEAVASLAGRWRKLELASWRRLLQRTIRHYAEGVHPHPHLHPPVLC